jgi:hypothetical protein
MGAKAGAVPSLAGRELTAKAAKQGPDALLCMPNRTECIPLFSVMFLVEQQGVAASWGSASEHGALQQAGVALRCQQVGASKRTSPRAPRGAEHPSFSGCQQVLGSTAGVSRCRQVSAGVSRCRQVSAVSAGVSRCRGAPERQQVPRSTQVGERARAATPPAGNILCRLSNRNHSVSQSPPPEQIDSQYFCSVVLGVPE